ncbi:MAG TPA: peptide chain release factor N(5)-glutamine methyltransferase [Candidatus Baltobacteraceae bacterium]|nr:peptide chain release factor N(5)-glutamine methyltransferase [Candidatus Baltobacteraceae bacterium]
MPENPLHSAAPTAETALKEGATLLRGCTPTASLDAALLLGHIIGVDRAWLLSRGQVQLTSAQYEHFRRLIAQRREGKPIAYITSLAGFYKRMFLVNENVLVPRPETEHLVEAAIEYLRERVRAGAQAVRVLEIGAGSGAVACSIAAEVPQAHVEGTDVSAHAVSIARRNAERLGVSERCRFRQADIAGDEPAGPFDAVVANLPYIPTADLPEKPDPAAFEPRIALDGGPDGMAVYARLLGECAWCLRGAGVLLMEAAPATMPRLRALTAAALPAASVEVRRDYGGLERFLYVTP